MSESEDVPWPTYKDLSRYTREDRVEMQEFDEGDDDDTVWFVRTPSCGVYHDDPDCSGLKGASREADDATRLGAQRRWFAPCRTCVLRGENG